MSYNSNLHVFKHRRSELRNNATKPEIILWSRPKGGQCNEGYDAQRTLYLEGLGLKVLRFTNDQVFNNLEGVVDIISQTPPNLPFKKERR